MKWMEKGMEYGAVISNFGVWSFHDVESRDFLFCFPWKEEKMRLKKNKQSEKKEKKGGKE